MNCEVYPQDAQLAVDTLLHILKSPDIPLTFTPAERCDLEQFLADMQSALADEAERQYIAQTTY